MPFPHRQGRTTRAVVGQVVQHVNEEDRPGAHLGPGSQGGHLLLETRRGLGKKTPGQEEEPAKERQGPGIKADPGQVSQQGPAYLPDFSTQGLPVAPPFLLGGALQFKSAQRLGTPHTCTPPGISSQVFTMRQAAENYLNSGMPHTDFNTFSWFRE